MRTHSIHIVRRYGLVGGMENYVFELTRALVSQGQQVTVICEVCEHEDLPAGLKLVILGNSYRKPRWLAQWGFAKRVEEYIAQHPAPEAIIHSHERSSVHHVTTFHGPPFLQRKKRLLDGLSPRIRMWTTLEKQELSAPQVQAILPNSPLIAEQLARLYPSISEKIQPPAYPGVSESFSQIHSRSSGLTLGFLGREWKRKGLDIACRIVDELRGDLPGVHFVVAGCDPDEIAHLFADWPKESYSLLGWIDSPDEFLGQIDLLVHPARSEPFGMAIAEANAAGIAVVVSPHCGVAALVGQAQGKVCDLDLEQPDISLWVSACRSLLDKPITVTPMGLSWDNLARQHIELYQVLSGTGA